MPGASWPATRLRTSPPDCGRSCPGQTERGCRCCHGGRGAPRGDVGILKDLAARRAGEPFVGEEVAGQVQVSFPSRAAVQRHPQAGSYLASAIVPQNSILGKSSQRPLGARCPFLRCGYSPAHLRRISGSSAAKSLGSRILPEQGESRLWHRWATPGSLSIRSGADERTAPANPRLGLDIYTGVDV